MLGKLTRKNESYAVEDVRDEPHKKGDSGGD